MFGMQRCGLVGVIVGLSLCVGTCGPASALGDEPLTATDSPESAADATATDQATAEALDVQRSLGGPLTNQFQQLRPGPSGVPWFKQFGGSLDAATPQPPPPTAGSPWPSWWTPARPRGSAGAVVAAVAETPATAPPGPLQIAALRRTAADLEATANRLEEIELYQSADALREFAQQLRADARKRLARSRDGARSAGSAIVTDSQTYPLTEPGHEGPAVYRDPAEVRDHSGSESTEPAYEERSVIVGPKPE
jgi:hypothetical protein